MRIKIFEDIIILFFLSIFLSLSYTQIIKGRYYSQLSQRNAIRIIPQSGIRGNIYDRAGRILAGNSLSFNLSVIPQGLDNKEQTFARLARIMKADNLDLINNYKKGYSLPFAPVVIKKNISKEEAIILEENTFDIKNVIVQQIPQRTYPYNKVGANVLGYINKIDRARLTRLQNYGYSIDDTVGYGGVEENLDSYLHAEDGGTQVEVDNLGRQIKVLGTKLPQTGQDAELTIDLDLEEICYNLLQDRTGAIIIMDPYNGDIYSMVSSPSFDPNIFSDSSTDSLYRRRLVLNDPNSPLLNRAISGRYPAGSLFKIVTAIAGLETKKISRGTNFFCSGAVNIGSRQFLCWSAHGDQNLEDGLTHSCNSFFYRLGVMLGPDILYSYATRLGLARPTGIDLPFEYRGFIPSRNWKITAKGGRWFDGDSANFAIGQGEVLVTPLQIVRLMAVVANGGWLVTPHVIKSITGGPRLSNKMINLGLNPQALEIVREGLLRVVQDPSGTANSLKIEGLKIAGKTGTAQAGNRFPHAWFAGFFPYQNPRFCFVVLLEHGGGSQLACVVARNLIEEMIKQGHLN